MRYQHTLSTHNYSYLVGTKHSQFSYWHIIADGRKLEKLEETHEDTKRNPSLPKCPGAVLTENWGTIDNSVWKEYILKLIQIKKNNANNTDFQFQ